MAAMTKTPTFLPSVGSGGGSSWLTQVAEGPVQDAGGVGRIHASDGAGAVQGDADDGVAVPGRLEQQTLSRGPGVPGLDPDRARVAAEQRVEVLPPVGAVPGTGGEPVAALGCHRAEDGKTHRGPAQDEQVRRGRVVRV